MDWFWQLSAARALEVSSGAASPRVLELTARALLAHEVAARTLRPPDPFTQPGNDALACELGRQALHWALLAHDAASAPAPTADGEPPPENAGPAPAARELPALFERVDGELLRDAAGGAEKLAALKAQLSSSTYLDFAELTAAEQRKLAERLESFTKTLLEPLADRRRRRERIWVRRTVHVLALVTLIGGVVLGVYARSVSQERKADLTRFATWKASSAHPVGGCQSPKQWCPGGENYFFHTARQDNPWVIFDLGKSRRVSGVEIDNRLDCCFEQVKPLVVEVSSNEKDWKKVAESKEEFSTFREHFRPVKARYVRIRVARPKAFLHLSRVRIYP